MLVAPNWDLSGLEGKGLFDWVGEGGIGEPVKVFGRGGAGGADDDTLLNKEDAELAKLHKVEEAAVAEDDDEEEEVLGGIEPSLRVVSGSTGL